jgi:hypothetical protein
MVRAQFARSSPDSHLFCELTAMIWGVLINPALLLEIGRAYYESLPQPDSDGLKELERELKELREREETASERTVTF